MNIVSYALNGYGDIIPNKIFFSSFHQQVNSPDLLVHFIYYVSIKLRSVNNFFNNLSLPPHSSNNLCDRSIHYWLTFYILQVWHRSWTDQSWVLSSVGQAVKPPVLLNIHVATNSSSELCIQGGRHIRDVHDLDLSSLQHGKLHVILVWHMLRMYGNGQETNVIKYYPQP